MPLLGSAALLLSFGIDSDAIAEHDHWHTHEHLPERLAIPGFLRGSRWVAIQASRRYLVLYEVATLATLTSGPYLERLNNPSAWTSAMMQHYRDMTRGFCSLQGSLGLGTGHLAYLVRFEARAESEGSLREWLLNETLPGLPGLRGIGAAHLLQGAAAAPMTNEQRIRGPDAAVDWALLVTGYERDALATLAHEVLASRHLEQRGAAHVVEGLYRLDYTLTRAEVVAVHLRGKEHAMFDHIGVGVSNFESSKAFFLEALAPLGIGVVMEFPDAVGLGPPNKPAFWLSSTSAKPAPLHLAFVAENHDRVDEFYRRAIAAGAKDNGPPGLRPQYHANYYAAFVIGPDGHNVEAVCHKPMP